MLNILNKLIIVAIKSCSINSFKIIFNKMWLKITVLILVYLQYCQSKTVLNTPKKLTNCKAQLDDNSIIDLTSQDKPDSPRLYNIILDLVTIKIMILVILINYIWYNV